MSDPSLPTGHADAEIVERRELLEEAGRIGIAAPAAALLLVATGRKASAGHVAYDV